MGRAKRIPRVDDNGITRVVAARLDVEAYDEVRVAVIRFQEQEQIPTLTAFLRKAVDLYLEDLREHYNESRSLA